MGRTKDAGAWGARLAIATVALCLVSWAVAVTGSSAAPSLEKFDLEFSVNQPGGHPDLEVEFAVQPDAGQTLKSVTFLPPEGFAIEPSSGVSCTNASFSLNQCPSAAQIGVVTVRGQHEGDGKFVFGTVPVYQLARVSSQFMSFGFRVPVLDLPLGGQALLPPSDDYRLHLLLDGLPQATPLTGFDISLWGVPAAPVHDQDRFPQGSSGCVESSSTSCNTPTASSLPQAPLTLYAVYCPASWASDVTFASYQDPEHPGSAFNISIKHGERCDNLEFSPTAALAPTAAAGYTATGLDLEVQDPQPQLPDALSPSELRTAVVTTQGLVATPNLAGHAVCPDLDAAISSDDPSSCPQASALGTVSFEVKGVAEPLAGKAFLASEENGARRLLLVASGGGLELKIVGKLVELGPERLKFSFADLPRLPIAGFHVHLDAQQGLFRTPVHCGAYAVERELVSWNPLMTTQKASSAYTISSGPGGAPCIGVPTTVAVHLDPASIAADGQSQTTATIEVMDADGAGVPAEQVQLASSDPFQRIGEVADHGDGTYSALITGSSTVGEATITATVTSPTPDVVGSATLLQTGSSSEAPAPLPPVPAQPAAPPAASPHCVVPNLRGKRLKAARKRIVKAGCALGRVKKRRGVTRKTGRIVAQTPKAGRRLPAGAPVKLKLG